MLKRLREIMGLSRAELAEKAGLSRRTIEAYELGLRTPGPQSLRKLADALGVTPGMVLGAESFGTALVPIAILKE